MMGIVLRFEYPVVRWFWTSMLTPLPVFSSMLILLYMPVGSWV